MITTNLSLYYVTLEVMIIKKYFCLFISNKKASIIKYFTLKYLCYVESKFNVNQTKKK